MPEEAGDRIRELGHHLRTPLTLINGYASLLQDGQLTAEQRQAAVELVLAQCAEMNRAITSLLEEASTREQSAIRIKSPNLQPLQPSGPAEADSQLMEPATAPGA